MRVETIIDCFVSGEHYATVRHEFEMEHAPRQGESIGLARDDWWDYNTVTDVFWDIPDNGKAKCTALLSSADFGDRADVEEFALSHDGTIRRVPPDPDEQGLEPESEQTPSA